MVVVLGAAGEAIATTAEADGGVEEGRASDDEICVGGGGDENLSPANPEPRGDSFGRGVGDVVATGGDAELTRIVGRVGAEGAGGEQVGGEERMTAIACGGSG